MNLDTLTFIINNHEKFIINLNYPHDIIHCCYQSHVSLFLNNKDVTIGKSIIADFAERLKKKLILALSNKLKLHYSIQRNIGYYWNQELNEEDPKLFLIKEEEGESWIGYTYLLWGTDSSKKNQQYTTWLYNDADGNIIFEVTPTYPETFIDPQDPAKVQAYQAWMESSYQPFFTHIIPQNVAIQWLEQASLILKTIQDNVNFYEEKNE